MLTPSQVALNCTNMPVIYQDGRQETVSIRQLEITELYKFIDAIALDEAPRIVAVCAGKPTDWINALTVASYASLAKLVMEQNFQRAMEIVNNDPIAAARFGKVLAQLQDAAVHLLKSSTVSSAAVAPSASAEGTSIESSSSPSPA